MTTRLFSVKSFIDRAAREIIVRTSTGHGRDHRQLVTEVNLITGIPADRPGTAPRLICIRDHFYHGSGPRAQVAEQLGIPPEYLPITSGELHQWVREWFHNYGLSRELWGQQPSWTEARPVVCTYTHSCGAYECPHEIDAEVEPSSELLRDVFRSMIVRLAYECQLRAPVQIKTVPVGPHQDTNIREPGEALPIGGHDRQLLEVATMRFGTFVHSVAPKSVSDLRFVSRNPFQL